MCEWGRHQTSAQHEVPRSYLSADGACEKEIELRVGAAATVIGATRKEVL